MVGDLKQILAYRLILNLIYGLYQGRHRGVRWATAWKRLAHRFADRKKNTSLTCFYRTNIFFWPLCIAIRNLGCICPFLLFLKLSYATTLVIPQGSNVVGDIEYAETQSGETLADIGLRYDIGYYEMVDANPQIDKNGPLPPNVRILIPSQFILPKGPHHGLVINLPEFRLYFFPENENIVITHPVGIGRKGWSTPIGVTSIVAKQANPTWHPTSRVLQHAAKNGIQFPDVFPSGPGNPLGKYALRLGWPTYLIHGTNRSDGIGERVSAGCIRMLPDDIDYLYGLVSVGTPVRVVNEPIKFGRLNGALYMEVHPTLLEQQNTNMQSQVTDYFAEHRTKEVINNRIINKEINRPTGVPKKVVT